MNLSLTIDFNQLKSLITQCGIEEKTQIVQMLEKDTLPLRFNQFMNRIRTDELTLKEITAEVETVREKNTVKKLNNIRVVIDTNIWIGFLIGNLSPVCPKP